MSDSADPFSFATGGQRILLISPQPWDGFHVSKHNYAKEIARLGNDVYFVEPPCFDLNRGSVRVAKTDYEKLHRVRYAPLFPYWVKFKFRRLFHLLMRQQARHLTRALGFSPDLVWDFDNAFQFDDLSAFGAKFSIFHPVDDFRAGSGHKGAALVLSNSPLYVGRSGVDPQFSCVVPHGLRSEYARHAKGVMANPGPGRRRTGPVRAGYVGNLAHPGVDWPCLIETMRAHPQAEFVFFGPYDHGRVPLQTLRQLPNCQLKGQCTAEEILLAAPDIDLWLLFYDLSVTVDGGVNPHKIMEYLATGKVVLSNWVDAHRGSDLIVMAEDQTNRSLCGLFGDVAARTEDLNSADLQKKRAAFSLCHTYEQNIETIARAINRTRLLRQRARPPT